MIRKLIIISICLFLASCGNNLSNNIDMSDPESVSEAYYIAAFDCGEKGAGLQYDLAAKPLPTTRAQWIDYQSRSGCKPRKQPEYFIRTKYIEQDYANIYIESGPNVLDQIILVRDGNEWHVKADLSSSPGQRL